MKNKPRASVSAEAFGSWNKQKAFEPKKFEKTPEQESAIRDKLNMAFMFSALDEKEKDIVIAAMQERVAQAKEHIIDQGDEGDCLYVIGQGTLIC
jgi:cAMP-dependent protein kinase regulator